MQPERFHTLDRLQIIQTHLINFITQTNYKIVDSDYFQEFFATCLNPQEANQLKIPRTKYSELALHSASNIIFDHNDFRSIQITYRTDMHNITTTYSPIVIIYEQFIKEMPSELVKQMDGIKNEKKHLRYATLHASNHLPDWLKSWRNTNLCMLWVLTNGVGKPTTIDRNKLLDYEAEIIPMDSATTVKFALNSKPYNDVVDTNSSLQTLRNFGQMHIYRFFWMHGELSYEPIKKLLFYLTRPDLTRLEETFLFQTQKYRSGCWRRNNEKALIRDYRLLASDCGLSAEQTFSLLHIFEDHSPIEALDYFLKHPGKLKKRDYCVLFRIALFTDKAKRIYPLIYNRDNYDGLVVIDCEGYVKKLASFIETQFKLNFHTKDFQVCAFLCQIQRFLRAFDADRILGLDVAVSNRFSDPLPNLINLLEYPDMKPYKRSIIFAEFLAYFSNLESDQISDVNSIWMIKGILFLKAYPIPLKWVDPIIENEYRQSICIHANRLSSYLLRLPTPQLNALLNALLKIALPNAEGNCEWLSEKTDQHAGPVFISRNNRYKYIPLTGDLFDLQQQTRRLPFEILRHPHFKKLFPTVLEAKYDSSSNTYLFNNNQQNAIRVCLNGDDVIIEQDLKEFGTVRYVPIEKLITRKGDKISSYLCSRYLVEGFNHWQTLIKFISYDRISTILICHPMNGSILYQATIHHSSASMLRLVNVSNSHLLCTSPSLLNDFEHPSYIHEWGLYNNRTFKIQKLELPRFSLTFNRRGNSHYVCDQIKGEYVLVPNTSLKQLNGYKHFLVVRNAEGKTKVILPQQNFKATKKSEILQPRFNREKNLKDLETKLQSYLVYDLSPAGNLIAHSLEAHLYLAHLLTLVQNYDHAAYHLKTFCNKLIVYSEIEADILLELCTSSASKDISGDACALKTYAGYLLLKNNQTFKKDQKKVIPALISAYTQYLTHYRNVTCIHLTRNEELHILSALLENTKKDHSTSAIFIARLRMLDLSHAIHLPIKSHETPLPNPRPIQDVLKSMYLVLDDKNISIDFNNMNITRFDLMNNWRACYTLIRNNDKQGLDWLHHVVCFLEASKKAPDVALAAIFRLFIRKQTSLPPLPKFDLRRNYSASLWSNEVSEKKDWQDNMSIFVAKELEAESTVKSSKSERSLKNYNAIHSPLAPPHDLVVKTPKICFAFPNLPTHSCSWDKMAQQFFSSISTTEMKEKWSGQNPAALWVEHQIKASKDELQIKAYEGLKKDFESLSKHHHSAEFQIKADVNLKIISEELSNGQKETNEIISKLEKEILVAANVLPEIAESRNIEEIMRMGGNRKTVSLNDVLFAYARWKQDPAALKRKNPQITDHQLSQVFEKTAHYLLLSSIENQRTRALNTLKELIAVKNDRELEYELVQQLASELMAKRCYKPDDHPAYLVFEHLNGPHGIFLRPEQVQKLESFLKDGNLNPIMEMIMGAGKSKVLLPLLAQLLAKPGILVTLIVPQSLFASVAGDTQTILMKTYGQPLKTIHFERNTPITVLALQTILNDLKTARENCEPLIITNKTLQCLMLKSLELFDVFSKTAKEGQPWTKEILLIREILTSFSHSSERGCVAVVDEVDSVMNVLKKVCFSLGQQQAPKNHEVRILLHLAQVMFTSKVLKEIARWESDPKPNMRAPVLTKEIYEKTFKTTLAEVFIHSLKELRFDSNEYHQPFLKYVESLKDRSNHTHLMHYLCHDKENNKTAQAYFNMQDKKIQEIIRVAGQAIGQFLFHAMTRVLNQNYGIDKDSGLSIAVPFLATNVPSKGSQFANPHITMLYTILSIFKEGVSTPIIQQEVCRLQSDAKVELAEKGSDELEKTIAYKKFRSLIGPLNLSFLKLKKADYEAITKQVNFSISTQCYFIEHIILPQMQLFSEQISCNPHNLVSFLKNVSGFTGTLWNEDNMHHSLKPLPATGIGAKTYDLLFKKSRDAIISLDESSTESMLQQLQTEKFDVVIDVGGYFKQDTNVVIARKIALHKQTSVVFYNHLGEQTITDGTKETPLTQSDVSENSRITFLDQDHTTGADIKYKRDAIGLVTIGRNTLERDLKQAVWRLRGLDKRQSVKFALSQDVRTLIMQASNNKSLSSMQLRLEDIIHFTIVNQTQQLHRDNVLSFTQQLWDIPQHLTFKLGLNDKISPQDFCQLWKSLRGRWITPGMHNASERYGLIATMIKRQEFLEENQKSCMQFFESFYKSAPSVKNDAHQLEIERLIKHMSAKLPSEILWPPYEDVEAAIEMEIHEEVQEEIEIEAQAEVQHINGELGFMDGPFLDFGVLSAQIFNAIGKTPRFDMGLYMLLRPEMKQVAKYFMDIKASINVFAWPKDMKSLEHLSLYGPYRTPLVFVSVDLNNVVTLLNQQDASKIFKNKLFSLTSYFISSHEINRPILKKIVKAKFLNGDVQYTAEEQNVLAEWFRESDIDLLKDFMLKVVLAGRPEAFAAFQGSILQKIFKDIKQLQREPEQKE